jgi:hypothetical protein
MRSVCYKLLRKTFKPIEIEKLELYFADNRWPNRDPIGELGFAILKGSPRNILGDGPNQFTFVRENPINLFDAWGLAGGAGKPNGSPCCLEDKPQWQVDGAKSLTACMEDWMSQNGSTGVWGALGGGGLGIWGIWNPWAAGAGLGLGSYEGGLAAQAYIHCSAGICVKWGHKNGCHCDP